MKKAWIILAISAFTDFIITAATAYIASSQSGNEINNQTIIITLLGGLIAASRTVQQALKSTPETVAALMGESSIKTVTEIKTP